MTTPTNDLRTDLTKLVDEHDAQTGPYARILHTTQIRALLAAHPAPETDAPVSDTRREDRASLIERALLEYAEPNAELGWPGNPTIADQAPGIGAFVDEWLTDHAGESIRRPGEAAHRA